MTALHKIGDYVDLPLAAEVQADAMPRCWYLLRLRPQQDHRVEREFQRLGISYYLPRFPRRIVAQRYRGRISYDRWVPLFPGLVFIPDSEIGRDRVHHVVGTGSMVRFGSSPAVLTPRMMESVRHISAAACLPASKHRRFMNNQRVRITDGPLEMWVGRIERLDGRGRIRVLIETLQRAFSVNVTEEQVEAV